MIDTNSVAGILAELRQPTSLERQINALKLLKHDIIGNVVRKEAWKSSGVLALLADILVSPSVSSTTWRGEEGKVILHAVAIVGSLVYGEPDCIAAIERSQLFGGLVRALEAVNVNSAIVIAALRALNNIADAIPRRIEDSDHQAFAAAVYSDNGQRNLRRILWQNIQDVTSQRQTILAARLLSKTCNTEARRAQAASSRCLESLALIMASHAARNRQTRSPASLLLTFTLRAVALIISESESRAYDFAQLYSEHLKSRDSQTKPRRVTADVYPFSRWNSRSLMEDKMQTFDPLFDWLLHIVKKESGSARLMAIWVITIYLKLTYHEAESDSVIASSLVPLLVQMLDQSNKVAPSALYPDDERHLMAEAPKVLALLISKSTALQEAAFEAGAVGKLAKLVKQANEPINRDRSKAFWSSSKTEEVQVETCLPQALCEQWRFREAVLQALAAIASLNDDYRKAVIEAGAVVPVVECLKPLDVQLLAEQQLQTNRTTTIRGVGNPVPVLLAACEAAKALSRSVSTLRTSLADANLAAPLAVLLKHPDVDVKIAATAAICNIVLDFSPMRQPAVDAGVINYLCDHARSTDARLKLNSLWALKHVVHSAPNQLKMQCINQLGPGWLKQSLERQAGAPVLPPISALTEGPGLFSRYDEDEVHMIDSPGDQWERGVDDVAIREQALGFVRNLLAGDGNTEMVDYILREVGQDKLFELLGNLLSGDDEVILAVLYIICNLAAGTTRHRQILVSQTNLLRLTLPLFQHPRAHIRSACSWLVVGLTWTENHEDRIHCRSRAYELRKVGIENRLEMLVHDADLDVRERTKTAIHQMADLLSS